MPAAVETILDPDKSYEIVDGRPKEKEVVGGTHGVISTNIAGELWLYFQKTKKGIVCTEVNFRIGANERIPDVAVLLADRIPPTGIPEAWWSSHPTLRLKSSPRATFTTR